MTQAVRYRTAFLCGKWVNLLIENELNFGMML